MFEQKLKVFERIQILMHEYDGLRHEIDGRTRDGFNLFSISVVLFVGVLAFLEKAPVWSAIAFLIGGLIALAIGIRVTIYRIQRAAARLRQIEATVNDLAGKPILEWETEWGLKGAAWSFEVWQTEVTPRKSKALSSS